MGRTVDYIERVSDAFEALRNSKLDRRAAGDVLCELFTRISHEEKMEVFRRISSHMRMTSTRLVIKGHIPPLMSREEVEASGQLAMQEPETEEYQ